VTRERLNFIWETAAIFFALFSLWPWGLGWRPVLLWRGVLLLALVLMVIVAYLRIRRVHRLPKERDKQGPTTPFGPLPPAP
jgi:hypothetical protein